MFAYLSLWGIFYSVFNNSAVLPGFNAVTQTTENQYLPYGYTLKKYTQFYNKIVHCKTVHTISNSTNSYTKSITVCSSCAMTVTMEADFTTFFIHKCPSIKAWPKSPKICLHGIVIAQSPELLQRFLRCHFKDNRHSNLSL